MNITIKKIEKHNTASIYNIGPYINIKESLLFIKGWLIENHLKNEDNFYIVYYNSPLEVKEDNLEWEIGVDFKGKPLESTNELQIQEIPETLVVSTIFHGPLTEASSVYLDLYEYANTRGYKIAGAVKEIYIKKGNNNIITEVQLPII